MIFSNKFGFILETVFSYIMNVKNKLECLFLAGLSSFVFCLMLESKAGVYPYGALSSWVGSWSYLQTL
jgi:hypothetical protein